MHKGCGLAPRQYHVAARQKKGMKPTPAIRLTLHMIFPIEKAQRLLRFFSI